MQRFSVSLSVLAVAGLLGVVGAARADQDAVLDKLNKKIDNVTLHDAHGKPASLYDLKGRKAVVVVFLSFECPVSNSYAPVLAELAKKYQGQKVAFVGVDSSDEGDAAWVAKQAAEFKLPFPVFKDAKHRAADALKATVASEAFVLDQNFVLRYRGRIDNAYAARLKRNRETTRHELRTALDELLAGKAVSEPATKAVGCPLHSEEGDGAGKVTYYRDVLPVLQEHCQQCHRKGEVGPFALMTYRQARRWAGDIKEYTQSRKMPPWKPVEGLPFHNDRRLSARDIATLAAWADGGTPEGDPKDAPAPRRFAEGWQLGEPDLVLTVPQEITVGPSGKDLFRVFVLPTGLTEDRYVTAVEVRPGNKRIVHHTLNFFDRSGRGREMEKAEKGRKGGPDHGPGYSAAMGVGFRPTRAGDFGGLGGWAPGQRARHLPAGAGYYLPKGADVLLQVHYHRNGRVEKDRTSIGLYFAKEKAMMQWKSLIIRGNFLFVPAGRERFPVHGGIEVEQDCTLHSVMPHMHMLGREIKVTLTPPGGKPVRLLALKDWDYNWQETYFLKESLRVKKGTRIEVEAVYDNSANNPGNPFDPPRAVPFGEQTDNEMCFVFLGATSDTPGRIRFKQDRLMAGRGK